MEPSRVEGFKAVTGLITLVFTLSSISRTENRGGANLRREADTFSCRLDAEFF